MKLQSLTAGLLLATLCAAHGAATWEEKDLNPVTLKTAPTHSPVTLVKDGVAIASIAVMQNAAAAVELRKYIAAATGVELPVVKGKVEGVAIVLGDCPEAEALGLKSSEMPPEGFAIKTAEDRVYIVGNSVAWGVYEFLERYVGMRWYFPPMTVGGPDIGQDIPKTKDLVVPPVFLTDAPVFRMRVLWPAWSEPWRGAGINLSPLHTFLRSGNSWPNQLLVHQPNWNRFAELKTDRPEVFQMRQDGTRQHEVICYGNHKTLETYLEGIQNSLDGKKTGLYAPIKGKSITVSPADVELACYCEDCRKLWDNDSGQYGGASKVMTSFVQKLATEVLKRWPTEDFTIIYLPYLNYTAAPDGYKFPGNVEVQICGMPGLACYKEPAINQSEQENIDKWMKIAGRKIQNWHYCCWPAHKTAAAYQYPHVIKEHYQHNRDKTVGTFINGTDNHWPRQHISLYCWLKVLWNPDYNVDAAVDAFCTRMFGPAAKSMRKLVGLQIKSWEDSTWPGGRFWPKGIYENSFPPEVVEEIKATFAQARKEGDSDPLVKARLDYYEPALKDFFKEAEMMSGKGLRPLDAQKTGENPTIDGKLDEADWARAEANTLVKATGKEMGQPTIYTSTIRALWTFDGITLGFHLSEPTPDLLETSNGGHDNGNMWWDDCVELFVDVTGKGEGEFYQFMVNPEGNYWDSKMKDTTWECEGFKAKAARGDGTWTIEVFLPFAAFPEGNKPGSGTDTFWTGNFTRHRVADARKPAEEKTEGSVLEYQRMNTVGGVTSDNLADFAKIRFIE